MNEPVPTVILGAAGRDFHNFNVVYRDDPQTRVVAFTATQIPGIAHRRYPAALAGPLYPDGIPIDDESQLEEICRRDAVRRVVFAYSDVTHETVMHLASRALAAGADFELLGPARTMLRATIPVIAVTAVRTGAGKSPLSRWLSRRARDAGLRVAVVRHPMPYGDLEAQAVQRFATLADLDSQHCTAEEREEYESHIAAGATVFAGVDYARILAAARSEADLIIWDGGNNDFPFYVPDLHIAVADALRPGQADRYHPGEAVLRMADVVVVNKVDSAPPADVEHVQAEVRALNPGANLALGALPITLDDPSLVRGKSVLVIEDGPTLTHGGMSVGAGYKGAVAAGAAEVIDPRPFAAGPIAAMYRQFPHIGPVLPALGYDREELGAMAEAVAKCPADAVVVGTPFDFMALIGGTRPWTRARYEFAEVGGRTLEVVVSAFLQKAMRRTAPTGAQR